MVAAQGTNAAQALCRSEAPIPTLLLVLVLVGFLFPLTSSRLSATDTGVFLASSAEFPILFRSNTSLVSASRTQERII